MSKKNKRNKNRNENNFFFGFGDDGPVFTPTTLDPDEIADISDLEKSEYTVVTTVDEEVINFVDRLFDVVLVPRLKSAMCAEMISKLSASDDVSDAFQNASDMLNELDEELESAPRLVEDITTPLVNLLLTRKNPFDKVEVDNETQKLVDKIDEPDSEKASIKHRYEDEVMELNARISELEDEKTNLQTENDLLAKINKSLSESFAVYKNAIKRQHRETTKESEVTVKESAWSKVTSTSKEDIPTPSTSRRRYSPKGSSTETSARRRAAQAYAAQTSTSTKKKTTESANASKWHTPAKPRIKSFMW